MRRLRHSSRTERGDTVVEVLIAIAILSLVIVGALRVMSAGQATAYNAVERTQVQALLSSQLSLVRYMRDEYIRAGNASTTPAAADWNTVVGRFDAATIDNDPCSGSVRSGFYITEDYTAAPASQHVISNYSYSAATGAPGAGNGVWLEAQQVPAGNFVDVVAKACWSPAGSNVSQQSKIVSRLAIP